MMRVLSLALSCMLASAADVPMSVPFVFTAPNAEARYTGVTSVVIFRRIAQSPVCLTGYETYCAPTSGGDRNYLFDVWIDANFDGNWALEKENGMVLCKFAAGSGITSTAPTSLQAFLQLSVFDFGDTLIDLPFNQNVGIAITLKKIGGIGPDPQFIFSPGSSLSANPNVAVDDGPFLDGPPATGNTVAEPMPLFGFASYILKMMMGDPHLAFIDGAEADFRGRDQHTYALLSAPRASFNVLIAEARYYITGRIRVNGTFVDTAYYTMITNTGKCVRVEHISRSPSPVHIYEGCDGTASFALPAGAKLEVDDVTVSFGTGQKQTVIVTSDEWKIITSSGKVRDLENVVGLEDSTRRQLDISLQALKDPLAPRNGLVVAPHGILGQSYDGDDLAVEGKKDSYNELMAKVKEWPFREVVTIAQAEGAIEGEPGDYELTGHFNTSFKYSRFNATKAMPPRDVSALTGVKRAAKYNWAMPSQAEGTSSFLDKAAASSA